mmetsp:Transcript_22311/g.29470  ORF Transcript_22311/g.29470 Transcript_22311/m.29470 type:complete len:85 (+) Transcript_22311:247-501(+)
MLHLFKAIRKRNRNQPESIILRANGSNYLDLKISSLRIITTSRRHCTQGSRRHTGPCDTLKNFFNFSSTPREGMTPKLILLVLN